MVDGRQRALKRIGRGRSAVVYRDLASREPLVHKVFVGEGLSKLVLFALTGSANPYTWCRPAIDTACARRCVLAHLVQFWFGDRLRLPTLHGWQWNDEHKAFELQAEFIDGAHASLRGPFEATADDDVRQLTGAIMRPLQDHLAQAGFDGCVWQAGRGNPVAAGNFMQERGGDGSQRWVWIDLESGVPALFSLNPLATLSFYLPKSLRHRRWLFDDVDVSKLRTYLAAHEEELLDALGAEAVGDLAMQVEALRTAQDAWRAISRVRRSIAYEYARGRLSEEEAHRYEAMPLRWYLRLFRAALPRAGRRLASRAARLWRWLRRLDLRLLLWRSAMYLSSTRYRGHVAGLYLRRRLRAWTRRRQMTLLQARALRRQLRSDESSAYIADFSVHLAIKPAVKFAQYVLVPLLVLLGVLHLAAVPLVLALGGAAARSAYTLGRGVQAAASAKPLPWVAFVVGLLPMAGNAAYPAQLLYAGTRRQDLLARFIIFDLFASAGRTVPIWGGPDSLLEHWANRAGGVLVDALALLSRRRAGRHRAERLVETKPAAAEHGEHGDAALPSCSQARSPGP
jgi:hypothetical protein